MSSPPNGIVLPAVGVHRHDVGVAHQQQRRRVGIAALEPGHEALAARLGLVGLDVERRALEVGLAAGRRCGPPDPTSTAPSLTHALRMRCCRRSVTSAVASPARVVVSVTIRSVGCCRRSRRSRPRRRMPSGSPSGANRSLRCGVRSIGPLRGTPHTDRLTTSRMSSQLRRRRRLQHRHGRSLPPQSPPARRGRPGLPGRAPRRPADRRRRRHLRPPHRRVRARRVRGGRPRRRARLAARPAPSAGATPSSCRSPTRPTP